MIDVSKIKDLKELQEMKDDLNFFINKKVIAEIYDLNEEAEDLGYDREQARILLNQVMVQIKKLSQPAKKRGTKRSSPPEP